MEREKLAELFDEQRDRLRGVAHRMLGSAQEAEDAVQETWLRLDRTDAATIENLHGWLRTVVTRICLDALRARQHRKEDPSGPPDFDQLAGKEIEHSPEEQAILADAVGRAVLVVLDRLQPAERVAFVLHDMYGVPFDEIAPLVRRTTVATKKLASRARQRVRGGPALPAEQVARQHRVVSDFLAATRAGDLEALLRVLAPDVVRRTDPIALPAGVPSELRGNRPVAEGTVLLSGRAKFAALAMIDGEVGLLLAPGGRLLAAITFTIGESGIDGYEVIVDATRLHRLRLGLLDPPESNQ